MCRLDPDLDPRGQQKLPFSKEEKSLNISCFAGFSLFRTEGFSYSLDANHSGLGIEKLHFFSFKVLPFLIIKTLDPDPELDSNPELQYLQGWIKIHIETNADTQHWW